MTTPHDASVIPLRCPHCKIAGTAILTEDAAATPTNPGMSLWWVSRGFRISRDDPVPARVEFRCIHCDEVAG